MCFKKSITLDSYLKFHGDDFCYALVALVTLKLTKKVQWYKESHKKFVAEIF